jgi:hypothetical protein
LEFDEGVIEVAIDVIVRGCCAEMTMDAVDVVDVFCVAAVSITLATVNEK